MRLLRPTRPRRPRLRPAALLATALGLSAAAPAAAAPPPLGSWNLAEQRAVAKAGLLAPLADGRFHGEQRLTGAQLEPALAALSGGADAEADAAGASATAGDGTLTVAAFDGLLVRRLGLDDLAAAVRSQAAAAGLRPPARFGSEVVARQLGLRTNHPAGQDALELYPTDPITRAEAAHSLAVMLGFRGWEVANARAVLGRFALPALTAAQRDALRGAVQRVGMPYVWGGELDGTSGALGGQVHGGYDCSGLVWRVFKLGRLPSGAAIRGRTAAQMAGEIPRGARLRFDDLRPGDLAFFGPARFRSRASEAGIVHVGIVLGNGFMLHSSSQGVTVAPLFEPWRRAEFSWGRRVL
jgi:cell wall-associated NlpC family hydrolase